LRAVSIFAGFVTKKAFVEGREV